MTDSERIAQLEKVADQHTAQLNEIGVDVKSLLATRSFTRGVWRAAVVTATMVSGLVTIVFEMLRYFKSGSH